MVVNAAPTTRSKRCYGGIGSSVLHSVGVICGDYKLPVPGSTASKARHLTRLLTACLGAVMFAILVASKYATDADVKASLYTYRTYKLGDALAVLNNHDYNNPATSPPNVVCPCSQYQVNLANFMTYSFVNPSTNYNEDLPKCRTDRSYGPTNILNNPGPNQVDYGCAIYFQAGAPGDEDYSYGWYCNSIYISMTCNSSEAVLQSDPSASTAVASSQLLNPRQLNESVGLIVQGATWMVRSAFKSGSVVDPSLTGYRTAQKGRYLDGLWLAAATTLMLNPVGARDEVFYENQHNSTWVFGGWGEQGEPGVANYTSIINGTALALRTNWHAYAEACAPAYCDITAEKTVVSRVVELLAVLGGAATFFSFVITVILWPTLSWLAGWD